MTAKPSTADLLEPERRAMRAKIKRLRANWDAELKSARGYYASLPSDEAQERCAETSVWISRLYYGRISDAQHRLVALELTVQRDGYLELLPVEGAAHYREVLDRSMGSDT